MESKEQELKGKRQKRAGKKHEKLKQLRSCPPFCAASPLLPLPAAVQPHPFLNRCRHRVPGQSAAGCASFAALLCTDAVLLVIMQAGMAWEDLSWDQRLLALTELSEDERGKLHSLIWTQPESKWETAVPKNRAVAVVSLKQLLAQAEAGMCWVAVTCVT